MIKRWWDNRIIKRSPISESEWRLAFTQLPLLAKMSNSELRRLRELTILLLHKKTFVATHDLEITQEMKLVIGLQACLPILNLSLAWYEGWNMIIVYPHGFVPQRSMVDENGVVHQVSEALSGEAWSDGPVVLSWTDVARSGELDGYNLVIHEFAHKLDMCNGTANGMPPLHRGMNRQEWTDSFSQAFADFQQRTELGQKTAIDGYAATDPAEFFAVLSEVFFEQPEVLVHTYSLVYKSLVEFYRQDPLLSNKLKLGNK